MVPKAKGADVSLASLGMSLVPSPSIRGDLGLPSREERAHNSGGQDRGLVGLPKRWRNEDRHAGSNHATGASVYRVTRSLSENFKSKAPQSSPTNTIRLPADLRVSRGKLDRTRALS